LRVLLTNDDGIDAPGLAALEMATADRGDVLVVAPSAPLSGCSHQVNTHRPIQATKTADHRYWTDGTPADCVRLGLTHLAPQADWVMAGVNAGGNLGIDVYLSGTVAAVREGALFGKPGIAFSQYLQPRHPIDWTAAVSMVRRVLDVLLRRPPKPGAFWNVNFPHLTPEQAPPEMVFCPLDQNQLPVQYEIEDGWFRYQGVYQERERTPGTDVDVCFAGRIAITEVLSVASTRHY
jgi:5'-nucleotidase